MARASTSDPFHSMRFAVWAGGDYNPFVAQAGFSAVTTPELSVESVEYREGQTVYTRKFPGNPSVSDLTLSRGVVLKDSDIYDWLLQAIEGGGQYRVDLTIAHYHRDALMVGNKVGMNNPNTLAISKDAVPARYYHVSEGFPIRCKPAGDLDATSSDVSIAEADVAYEHFWIEEKAS